MTASACNYRELAEAATDPRWRRRYTIAAETAGQPPLRPAPEPATSDAGAYGTWAAACIAASAAECVRSEVRIRGACCQGADVVVLTMLRDIPARKQALTTSKSDVVKCEGCGRVWRPADKMALATKGGET